MQNFSVSFVPSPELDEETKRMLVLVLESVTSVAGTMHDEILRGILRGLATTQRIQQEECCWPDEHYD